MLIDYCFFDNDDKPAKIAAAVIKGPTGRHRIDDSLLKSDQALLFRSPHDLHELFVDKLQFFIEVLNLMNERHLPQFSKLVFDQKFKTTLFNLLKSGETSLRLKCHEILEIMGTYFVQFCSSRTVYEFDLQDKKRGPRAQELMRGDPNSELMQVDFINKERLYIAQMMVQCVRKSFEMNDGNDAYLQFNSLILLDFLFQNLLPVPSF